MKKLYLKYKDIIKNAGSIVIGIILGKGVVILLTPLLTVLYLPEEFGTLAVFVSGGQILSVVYTLKYEISFLNTKSERHEELLIFLRTTALYLTIFSLLIAFALFHLELIKLVYCFIPIYAFILNLYAIERIRRVYSKDYKIIS